MKLKYVEEINTDELKPKQIILPKLEPWQKDVYEDIKDAKGTGKIFVVKAKRQVGKTILAEVVTIKYALENRITVCIAQPTLAQCRRCFKQIKNMLQGSGCITSANNSLLIIETANGSEILFKSAEQEDNLRGMTLDLLIIDECAFWKNEVLDILFPTTDAKKAPILLISTPLFNDGYFYDFYMKGVGEGSSGNVRSYNWSTYDTSKYLTKDKLELYKSQMTPNRFQSEYMGEFISEGSYVFGNILKNVKKATDTVPIYGGIDFANGGDNDFTVLTLLNAAGNVIKAYGWNNLEPTRQVDTLAEKIGKFPTLKKINAEMNSIGTVYFDFLKAKLKKPEILQGFNTTNDSKRRIIENLAKAFNMDTITIPDDHELKSELQHYAIEKTSKGYTYNGVSGFHDDYVMSLAIAYDLVNTQNGNYAVKVRTPKHKKTLAEKYG